ncbi:MAG: hypothetical protein H0W21_05710 [Actinobacteria bacterium]|nr:hypothetical protein [Actinomycetota bacterium]
MRRVSVIVFSLLIALAVPLAVQAHNEPLSRNRSPAAGSAKNFELVGHNPLFRRGMNAAPAIYKDHLYVGNRTDGSRGHDRPGVLVVDIKNPRHPRVVHEIGPPDEGVASQSSRELRVWPEKKLLIVMNFTCSTFIHACAPGEEAWSFRFYDLSGSHAARPKLISTYKSSLFPHEMFLWEDPVREKRALLYISTPHSSESLNDDTPNLVVTDISKARQDQFEEVATFTANPFFTAEEIENQDVALHSMATSPDGQRTYLSYLGGGFMVLDTTELAANEANPKVELISPAHNSPRWPNQTVHSAVKMLGSDYVVTTDEIYGDLLDDFAFEDHGCPWGWAHIIDVSDEVNPQLVGEYKIDENKESYCRSEVGQDPANTYFTSYSVHNPTVLSNVGLFTWHSGGLQAMDLSDAGQPQAGGFFYPKPLADVDTEDPALSQGLSKVVMWSYPIIKDGLIYVIDVRNGLYILRYTGPQHEEIASVNFFEGNSNLGDAVRLDG